MAAGWRAAVETPRCAAAPVSGRGHVVARAPRQAAGVGDWASSAPKQRPTPKHQRPAAGGSGDWSRVSGGAVISSSDLEYKLFFLCFQ